MTATTCEYGTCTEPATEHVHALEFCPTHAQAERDQSHPIDYFGQD
ncbi:hypothetical protein IU433_17565 [Nocardia puris]|nr:hypothetical protein [Nocardia puris]MBF6212253.1 hypothetical protein [Nocardia puris]MBF6366500.1 hypothetical protein [Nocardia puris]MBF6460842.1 hypothetical protein [Nocardia puris]